MNNISENDITVNKLMQDPVLKKAMETDPSVKSTILGSPSVFKPEDELLINMSKNGLYNNDAYNKVIYDQYLDGTLDKELYKQFLEREIDNPNFVTTGLFKSDEFWVKDPRVLYENQNYYRIIPSKKMSKIEMLNALSRFFIYFLVLLLLFS